MSDVSRDWRVARTCWGVLNADKILLSLPVALARDWVCNTALALLHCVHAGLTGERCSVAEGFPVALT